ncbi:MAG: two-component system, LuxR family, response regulator DctR [Verrucomicrobia bacterium]|nr:MAG: two-component system, LuxR family, response regulator DctR [Verrucomicrobiota bacterium]
MPDQPGDGVALHLSDPSSSAPLCKLLQASGIRVTTQGLIDRSRPFNCWSQVGCIVAELESRNPTALTILRTIRQLHAGLPVIFVAEKPQVSTVVESIKCGAFDFFERPWDPNRLAARIEEAITTYRRTFPVFSEIARVDQLLRGLTRRERQLFDLILDGKSTKEMAFELGIRDVTVDFHRRNLYRKMEVDNPVNLALMIENYRHERQKWSWERTAF